MTAARGLTPLGQERSLDPPVPPAWVAARIPRGPLEGEAVASLGALIRVSEPGGFPFLREDLARETDTQSVLGHLGRILPEVDPTEAFAADLCRPELLVEVEGVLHPHSAGRGSPRCGATGADEVRT